MLFCLICLIIRSDTESNDYIFSFIICLWKHKTICLLMYVLYKKSQFIIKRRYYRKKFRVGARFPFKGRLLPTVSDKKKKKIEVKRHLFTLRPRIKYETKSKNHSKVKMYDKKTRDVTFKTMFGFLWSLNTRFVL